MKYPEVTTHIVKWLNQHLIQSAQKGFVIGISGGIDSAVTSTLCALTGAPTLILSMPIKQHAPEYHRAQEHCLWLKQKFSNVETQELNLDTVWMAIETAFTPISTHALVMANSRSRLRMLTLYAFAGSRSFLVAGTGNKIEDFGIGFFTKYGDGGVDISPIADLFKSEVYALGRHLQICNSILSAKPTDGLFADGRTDEDQIGATYDELEWAMKHASNIKPEEYTERQRAVLEIYRQRHNQNAHKMKPIPVCSIPQHLKT